MIKRILLITVFLVPLAALAEPATRGSGKGGRTGNSGPPFTKRPTSRPSDEKEFANALAFFEKISPNRYKAYQSLDDDRKNIFRERILAFYRVNLWINFQGPGEDMRTVRQKLLRAEDDVFAVRWDILMAGGPRKASDEDRAKLREAVKALVTLQNQERSLRLEKFKKYVKQEEEKLAADLANPDQQVDERFRDELEGKGVGLFDHPRRRDGGGGPGGGGPGGGPGLREDREDRPPPDRGDKPPRKDK